MNVEGGNYHKKNPSLSGLTTVVINKGKTHSKDKKSI